MIQRHLKKFQSEPEGVKPFIEISTSQAQPEKGEFSERDLMIQEQAGVITRMIPKNGIFDLFDQECKLASNKETPILNFAASLSLCSVLAANKLRYNDTWPNMYIAALAPSGVGKNNPQRMIKRFSCNLETATFFSALQTMLVLALLLVLSNINDNAST